MFASKTSIYHCDTAHTPQVMMTVLDRVLHWGEYLQNRVVFRTTTYIKTYID